MIRQWKLLRPLSARHCRLTIKEMIEEFVASDETLRRNLETFVEAGFTEETVEKRSRNLWRVNLDKSQPGPVLAHDEAMAVYGLEADPDTERQSQRPPRVQRTAEP